MGTWMLDVLWYYAGTQVFSPGLSGPEFEKNPLRMFELCLGAQFSVFLCFERFGKQLSELNNRLLAVFNLHSE